MRSNVRAVGLLVISGFILLADQRLLAQSPVVFTAGGGGTSQLGSPQTVTATLLDGGTPVANVGVSFTITSGPRTGLGALVHTDASGQAAWTYTGTGPAGTDVILAQAAYGGTVHSSSASATWTLPTFGVSSSGTSQLGSPQTITATLSTNGVAVSGAGVNFFIIAGPRTGQGAVIHTGPDGRASWTYTGIGPTGADVIQASVAFAGIALAATGTLDWTLPDFTLTPAEATVSPGAQHTVTATLRTSGLPVPGASVSFRITDGPNAGPGPVVPTDASGQARWTYTGRLGGFGPDTVEAGVAFAGIALSSLATATWGGEADLSIAQRPIDADTNEELEAVFRTFPFAYQLAIANAGPGDGRDVLVEGTLPAGMSYVSDTCGGSGSGRQWSIALGTLASGTDAMTCLVQVTVDASAVGPLINTVRIGGSTTDPDLTNNVRERGIDVWQLVYYGVGDSVAAGHGLFGSSLQVCREAPGAYPRRVATRLRDLESRYERVIDAPGPLACSGAQAVNATTTICGQVDANGRRHLAAQIDCVLAHIRIERGFQKTVGLVSITIGANDFPWVAAPGSVLCAANFPDNVSATASAVQAQIGTQLQRLLAEEDVAVVVTAYHNPFNPLSTILSLLNGPAFIGRVPNLLFDPRCAGLSLNTLYRRADTVIQRLNTALQNAVTATLRPDAVRLASLYLPFETHKSGPPACGVVFPPLGTWIQLDCFHPNGAGAAAYAATVEQAARPLLP